jgi:acetyl esterase/lipase
MSNASGADAASERFARLQALGSSITPAMIAGTIGLYAPLQPSASADVKITRDLRYGDADRHRLDLFAPAAAVRNRPVLVYVHGGGFVGGDKTNPGSPFYDNVGLWAVRHGFIGVTMTYRLAPAHKWPSGSDDVGRAARYLREHVAAHGGDPDKIYIMGQSAGGTHVGGYVAREHSPSRDGWNPAGAILVSGLFDTSTMDRNAYFEAYFSSGATLEPPFLDKLASSKVPLMIVTAELDPVDFLRQNVALLDRYVRHHQRLPHYVHLLGHNHLSTVQHLNTGEQSLAQPLLRFMQPD